MFQNIVQGIPRGYPGGPAGGIFYPTLGKIVTGADGVTIGNFCYKVTDQPDQVVGINTAATGGTITSGTISAVPADFQALTNTGYFTLTLGARDLYINPTFAGTDTTLALVATKVQTALQGVSSSAITFTYNSTTNKFTLADSLTGAARNCKITGGTPLANMLALLPQNGAVTVSETSGLELAGICFRQTPYSTYDPDILFTNGYSNNVPAGQTVEVLNRGCVFVTVTGLFTGVNVPTGTSVFSRDLDGAIFLGSGSGYSGYSKSNFVTTDPSDLNIVNGLIRISNTERVEV